MLSIKKLLTKILLATKEIKPIVSITRIDGTYKATAADTWQYNGGQVTVPSGHVYLVRLQLGWNTGRPIGMGLSDSTTPSGQFPTFNVENPTGVVHSPVFLLYPGTYYMFEKRQTAPSSANNYYINALDINMNGVS